MFSFKTGILNKSIVILTVDNGGSMVIKNIFKLSNFHFVKDFLLSVLGLHEHLVNDKRCAVTSEEVLPSHHGHKHFHNFSTDNSQLHTPSFYSQNRKEKYPFSAPNKLFKFDKLFSFPLN